MRIKDDFDQIPGEHLREALRIEMLINAMFEEEIRHPRARRPLEPEDDGFGLPLDALLFGIEIQPDDER